MANEPVDYGDIAEVVEAMANLAAHIRTIRSILIEGGIVTERQYDTACSICHSESDQKIAGPLATMREEPHP